MPRWISRSALIELVLVCLVFGVSAWWGTRYDRAALKAGQHPYYYQQYFEPAVMVACGRSFEVSTPPRPPALDDFLFQRTDRFDCASLPSDLRLTTRGEYQFAWYYLMMTVAAAWRLLGVSWSGLAPLFGLLFGLVVTLAYGLFRVATSRAGALVCAAAVGLSTLHLENLPALRDYAKAPFVLALVLLLFWIVWRPMRPRWLLAVSALYGVILGVGYGFRTDLLANIPPFAATVLCFLPGGVRRNLKLKAAALVLAAATFVGTAWPVARYVTESGGCQWHVVLLGLATNFNGEVGVKPSFYQWNPGYADMLLYTAVTSYVDRTRGPARIDYCSPEYDAATAAYLRDIVVRFPADMMTRAYASVLRILDLPFPWWHAPLPNYAAWAYEAREWVLKPLAGAARLAALVAVLLIGASDLRLGLFALTFVLYFAGYPALQFANRHYFHLEFIGWWAMAFVVTRAALAVRRTGVGTPTTRADWRAFGIRAARFATIAALVVAVPVPILRAYQRRQVAVLTGRLLYAPRVLVKMVPSDDGKSLRLPGGAIEGLDAAADPMLTAYLDVHIDLAACPSGVPLGVIYGKTYPAYDFSQSLTATPPGKAPMRVLVPVYRYFEGLDLGGAPAACVTRVERLASLRDVGLLPMLTLPPDWQSIPFHQSLAPIDWWPPALVSRP